MPQRTAEDHEWDDDEPDWQPDDVDEPLDDYVTDHESPTIDCPYCKRAIHEESQQCPYCEQYISEEDEPSASKPWWVIIGAVLCLFTVLLWILG